MASPSDKFDLARTTALDCYGRLEWELSQLLQTLLDIPSEKATLIFYRIVNSRARYAIIDDLISLSHPELKCFWQRLEGLLQSTDTKRNQITHWMKILHHPEEVHYLENPVSILRHLPEALKFDENALTSFGTECTGLGWIVSRFRDYAVNPDDRFLPQALIEIFQKPPVNLKQAAFRQALFDAAHQDPRGSSPA